MKDGSATAARAYHPHDGARRFGGCGTGRQGDGHCIWCVYTFEGCVKPMALPATFEEPEKGNRRPLQTRMQPGRAFSVKVG